MGSLLFIVVPMHPNPPLVCFLAFSLDTCPIKALMKMVESGASCKITVQELFPH